MSHTPEYIDLFNVITRTPMQDHVLFSTRHAITKAILAAGWRPPAEKGDHEIVWHLDGDMVRGEAVCNLPVGADCRITCPHECESWSFIWRDERGPYHLAYSSETDADARHDMVPMHGDECNVTLFLNEDPGWISELHASTQRRQIGRLPIAPKWLGDHFQFDVVEGGA